MLHSPAQTRPHRLTVRTGGSHPPNGSSILPGVTKSARRFSGGCFCFPACHPSVGTVPCFRMAITPRELRIILVTALTAAGIAYLAFVPAPVPAPVAPEVAAPVVQEPAPVVPAPAPTTTPKPVAPKPVAPKPTAEVLIPREGYNETVRELVLTATKQESGVALRWTPSTSAAFQGYRVVRSTENPFPYFPKDPAIRMTDARDNVSYVDGAGGIGKTYHYRVCALINKSVPTCGNIVKISF